jgi:hypothetical protein
MGGEGRGAVAATSRGQAARGRASPRPPSLRAEAGAGAAGAALCEADPAAWLSLPAQTKPPAAAAPWATPPPPPHYGGSQRAGKPCGRAAGRGADAPAPPGAGAAHLQRQDPACRAALEPRLAADADPRRALHSHQPAAGAPEQRCGPRAHREAGLGLPAAGGVGAQGVCSAAAGGVVVHGHPPVRGPRCQHPQPASGRGVASQG